MREPGLKVTLVVVGLFFTGYRQPEFRSETRGSARCRR